MLVYSGNVDQYGYHPANDVVLRTQKTPESFAIGGKMRGNNVRRRTRLTDNRQKRCKSPCTFRQPGWHQPQANRQQRIFVPCLLN